MKKIKYNREIVNINYYTMKHQLELDLFEQWLPIEGYEDLYQVSNLGRVKSLNYRKSNQEQILKQDTNKKGYQQVQLYKDRKPKTFRVHRLVANAFIPNPNNLPQVNHKDEVKANNHVSNLEWCTVEYNINYGTRNEKVSKLMYGKLGKDCPNSKQVIQLTLSGEVVRKWDSTMDIQRELGYNQGNISKCCKGKRKTSNGYKWCYA